MVETEIRCRILIWRTFGRIHWRVIPEPRITSQGATTWWIHCHDSRATCHIARIPSAILKIVFRVILLSVQCNAWTEYKFTSVCVCLCVCPSHFLSTHLQVRPLKLVAWTTRIYARMCLLGVSRMNNHIYGSKLPQNSHFGDPPE